MQITYQTIGVIHSPFADEAGMPIQSVQSRGVRGRVEVFPKYAAGLADLEGFSHVILLYHFHRVPAAQLTVVPFLDDQPRGVFATRAPTRPNAIGLSVVRLLAIHGSDLEVENVDVLEGTPLLDIKPYVPRFDVHPADRTGWLEKAQQRVDEAKSDVRFASGRDLADPGPAE